MTSKRTDRFDLRVHPYAKEALQAADALRHKSVSEFILDSALGAADEILANRRDFGLNAEPWQAFQSALEKIDPKKIIEIVDGKIADIEKLDTDIMMESAGIAMALDKLRESLDKVETCMDERAFEEASHVGYNEVAHNFVYVQRTLAGLQSAVYKKEILISNIAQEANAAYENVSPYIEEKMQSSIKKRRGDRNRPSEKTKFDE